MTGVSPALMSASSTAAAPRKLWLNVTEHLDARFGGVCAVLPPFCRAVSAHSSFDLGLAGFCVPDELPPANAGEVQVHQFASGLGQWVRTPALRERFRELVGTAAGVHIHGLWQEHCLFGAYEARRQRKPYLISAHGMLDRWALHHKWFKKAVYAGLFERRNLGHAACLHALTATEAADYRRFGLRNPIAIIPNGVQVPTATPDLFRAQFPALEGRRLILFLSRLHPKKGLDLLCQAWSSVAESWPDAHLVLAGPDFEGTRASLERMLAERNLRHRVTFTGMLSGEIKWSALAAADLFVLPSYSEGFSVAVLEAMGMGVPVLVTEQCNIPEVAHHGCGWVIPPSERKLVTCLHQFLRLSDQEAKSIGAAGQNLVRTRYSWSTVGQQMAAVYEWLLGGDRPAHVEIVR